jgi:DNA-binding beta-propeller fold protein YncE
MARLGSEAMKLVLDPSHGGLMRVSISGASSTSQNLPTPFVGMGSIAVSPGNTHVLMSGGDPTVRVAPLPLPASNALFTAVVLPSRVPPANTQAIAFDCAGRAFIYHDKGVSVLDPPYTSVAFTMNLVTPIGGAIALTPDGQHLLLTIQDSQAARVAIFDAPFTTSNVGALLTIPAASTVAARRPPGSFSSSIVVSSAVWLSQGNTYAGS